MKTETAKGGAKAAATIVPARVQAAAIAAAAYGTAPKATPKATAPTVKPNPAFIKKGTRTTHGTQKDTATSKAHWEGMGMQYVKDQLEKRGFKFKKEQFRGKGALKKRNLLDMLYRADKIS